MQYDFAVVQYYFAVSAVQYDFVVSAISFEVNTLWYIVYLATT